MAAKKTTTKKADRTPEQVEAVKKALEAVEEEAEKLKDDIEEIEEKKEASEKPELDEIADTKEEEVKKIEEVEEEDDDGLEQESEEKEENEQENEAEDKENKEESEKEKSDSQVSSFGPMDTEDKNQNSLLWKFVYVVAFFVGVGGAILIWKFMIVDAPQSPPVVEESVTPTVTPTPVEEIDYSGYPITVQNGSGQVGVAGAAKDLLESNDFSVKDTGNADNYDYEQTEIKAGEDVPEEVVSALVDVLDAEYDVSEDIGDYDENEEILVIIGSEKK